jgi:DNA-binding NarL/FixJ family response regulator
MGEDGIAHRFQVSCDKTLFHLSHTIMSKPRILLISSQHLFGESMETILRADKDVELVGPWSLGDKDIYERLIEASPSVIVIADENLQSEAAAELTKTIIEKSPEVSVIRTGLNENTFRIVSTHTLPARGADLLETIHDCIVRTQD